MINFELPNVYSHCVSTIFSLTLDDASGNVDAIDIGDTRKPRSIALHALKRYLFWTDVGSNQSVYRSEMDGSNRIALVQNVTGVGALTVDANRDLVYFSIDGESIEYMNLDGTNRY